MCISLLHYTGPRHFTKQVAVTYRAFWIRSDQVADDDVGLVFVLETAFFLLLLRLLLLRLSRREKQKHELEKAPLAFKVVSSSVVVGRANASSTVAVSVASAFLLLRRPRLCPLLLHIHHTQGPV